MQYNKTKKNHSNMNTHTAQKTIRLVRDARVASSTQKAILYTLASRVRSHRTSTRGLPIVATSYGTLAGDCGISRSTCIVTIKQLCNAGLILKTIHGKNHYEIITHNIKQLCNGVRMVNKTF